MLINIKVPSPGESITQVILARWIVKNNTIVAKDEDIAEIESDKATLTVCAEQSGEINFLVQEGDVIDVGSVICTIEDSKKDSANDNKQIQEVRIEERIEKEVIQHIKVTPLAKKLLEENNLKVEEVSKTIVHERIYRNDVYNFISSKDKKSELPFEKQERKVEHKKMTSLRIKLSERLVNVKNQTAMLTTFNEIDMSNLLALKEKYSEAFKNKHGISLGLLGFFTKAVSKALQMYPEINAFIEGDEIVFHHYADIGIAVQSSKGLLVPVIRNVESISISEIEMTIKDFGLRGKSNKILLEEMLNGTFTISNGGVFGSLMSTPILNPPQSAILGLHKIFDRPMAINKEVVIRSMMYVALSYDHRVIDGKQSVGFLIAVKDFVENPEEKLFESVDITKSLGL